MSEKEVHQNELLSTTSSRNLSIMAAAAEQLASKEAQLSRSKLVLPNLTTAVQEDMALLKGSAASTTSKPLSIGSRPEFAEYQLVDITTPHPNGE